jgi:hypothetical protein
VVVVTGFWFQILNFFFSPVSLFVCFGSSPLSAVENLLAISSGKVVVGFARVTKCVRNRIYT